MESLFEIINKQAVAIKTLESVVSNLTEQLNAVKSQQEENADSQITIMGAIADLYEIVTPKEEATPETNDAAPAESEEPTND